MSAPPGFAQLGVPEQLVEVLASMGAAEPFPIQAATLEATLAGRDVLGRGRTGSGKTIAFAVPAVVTAAGCANPAPRNPHVLILAPTRELVDQIAHTVEQLCGPSGLRVTTVYGGVNQKRQVAALNAGVDIVVACPGRLEDLMTQGHITLAKVQVTVLDEADHMSDLGFLPAVRRILDTIPRGGQHMLFSATLDAGVNTLVTRYLNNPVRHSVDPEGASGSLMTHQVVPVEDATRVDTLIELVSGGAVTVVFARTKHRAKRITRQLRAAGVNAVELHGNLAQARRVANLDAFSTGEATVMVATDIAARGIHVDDVEQVIHVDPPHEHKAYLHRSGRTARAGSEGTVITLVDPSQTAAVKAMMSRAGVVTNVGVRRAARSVNTAPAVDTAGGWTDAFTLD